jgi:DNA-directed RNA polymerase specialized sigma24 family protein
MGSDLSRSSTQWTLIVRAQGHGPEGRAALGQLIGRYERSIVSMIRCLRPPPNQTPEEIKQEFLTRVLERDDFAALDSSKGSFRCWLKQAVRRHLFNAWDARNAQKNPERHTDHPDGFDATCGESESPEQIMNRKFAADTLSYVVQRLAVTAPDPARFEVLKRYLPGPELSLDALAPIARQLHMTVTALRKAIYDLRERFKILLTEAVADTLDIDPTDPAGKSAVERELALLYRSLCEPSKLEVQLHPG